jgi:uncharacterized protein with ParB-like and HNH nuclease domain
MAFHIKAATQTLFIPKADFEPIFNNTDSYFIPIYQRPYTWQSKDVKRLLDGIVETFQKNEVDEEDPYFMGTIQVKPESESLAIIDGQQRLTTMLLIFKALDLLGQADCKVYDNRLSSKVSTQTENLTAVFELTKVEAEHEKSLNIHIKRLSEIVEYLKQLPEGVELSALVTYLKSNLYFVVINTDAGLSKTIDIFNTINTTGQDLSTGDIFKVQLFEYLQKYQGAKDDVFTEIDELYKLIDKENKRYGWNHATMNNILEVYRPILIEKHGLGRNLYEIGIGIFWERFFSVLLKNENQQGLSTHKEELKKALSIDDLKKIIEVTYTWNNLNVFTPKVHAFSHLLWWHGRYNPHHKLTSIYLYKYFETVETFDQKQFEAFSMLLLKYLFAQALRFKKQVNETHRFIYKLTNQLVNESIDVPMETLRKRLLELQGQTQWTMENNVFEVKQRRNFLSWLTAMLYEAETLNKGYDWETVIGKYFNYNGGTNYDIEHIQASQAKSSTIEWQNHLNTFGNLILLESSINRSISNDEITNKLNKDNGKQSYNDSKLPIVQQFIKDFDTNWTTEKVESRRAALIETVMNFLFK